MSLSAGEHYMSVSKMLGHASFVTTLTVYADYITGRVWLRSPSGAVHQVGSLNHISGFGVTGGGELYAVTLDGGLYALTFHQV